MQKIKKNLIGHSGCSVQVLELKESGLVVRKFSKNIDYNKRLKVQMLKQKKFQSSNGILAPKVLASGELNGLYYFDMEYIKGISFAEHFSDIKSVEIANFIQLLFKNLQNNNCVKNPKVNEIFKNKILELKKTFTLSAKVEYAFDILEKFDWSYVYESSCHGDLTFENIIITAENKIYLIDFLDSFYDSWLIDIAKILQDIVLKWSFRKTVVNQNLQLRLLIANETLTKEVLKLDDGEKILATIYHILLLNILRIYPYSKDNQTVCFLDKCLDDIFDIITKKREAKI